MSLQTASAKIRPEAFAGLEPWRSMTASSIIPPPDRHQHMRIDARFVGQLPIFGDLRPERRQCFVQWLQDYLERGCSGGSDRGVLAHLINPPALSLRLAADRCRVNG